jgi:hypothetical protein
LQAVGGGGPVKEAHEGEQGEFAPRFVAAVGQPLLSERVRKALGNYTCTK